MYYYCMYPTLGPSITSRQGTAISWWQVGQRNVSSHPKSQTCTSWTKEWGVWGVSKPPTFTLGVMGTPNIAILTRGCWGFCRWPILKIFWVLGFLKWQRWKTCKKTQNLQQKPPKTPNIPWKKVEKKFPPLTRRVFSSSKPTSLFLLLRPWCRCTFANWKCGIFGQVIWVPS